MKKNSLIVLVCLIMLITINNCITEEFTFTFRNGISFGDDMESVRSKEPSAGRLDQNTLACFSMTLSGISNSAIHYYFEFNQLNEIQLFYRYQNGDISIATSDYETINDGLCRKYGQPVEDIENATTYKGGAIETIKSFGEGDEHVKEKTEVAKNQWVIKVGENRKIVIEHVLLSYIYQSNEESVPETKVIHRATYQYLESDAQPTDIIDRDL